MKGKIVVIFMGLIFLLMLGCSSKYANERQGVSADLNKAHNELKQEMAKPTPDEGKLKDLITRITGDQVTVMNSYKSQRDEEMGQLKPKQEAHHIMDRRALQEQLQLIGASAQMFKGLNLPPDKAKQFEEVDKKYAKERQDVSADFNKAHDELKQEMAKSIPDEGKLKGLITRITGDRVKLMNSYKSQRDEEMGLLTPKQQAQYIMAMRAWQKQQELVGAVPAGGATAFTQWQQMGGMSTPRR